MLTDLCQELRNWFDRYQPKINGKFVIEGGQIYYSDDKIPMTDKGLLNNQYIRIIGSVFNDGVSQYKTSGSGLSDETFCGAVWFMAIPPAVLALNNEIDDWINKYESAVNSPFNSESFGGYSYSKGTATGGANGSAGASWQATFRSRLNKWRKL